jgi:hypothetical protein
MNRKLNPDEKEKLIILAEELKRRGKPINLSQFISKEGLKKEPFQGFKWFLCQE